MSSSVAKTGLWGVVFYAVAMNFGIRWLATGAAIGPASLPIWLIAALLFLIPLSVATLELSARYPHEGAVYAWSGETLGPLAGFVCGWIYWACNLPFFTGILVFVIDLLSRLIGGELGLWLTTPFGLSLTSACLIGLVGTLHARGLGTGQWLPILGAAASLALLVFLIFAGFFINRSVGSATNFSAADYAVPLSTDGAILWSTMVFAYSGAEGVALLRNEVKGGVKQISKALIWVGLFLCAAYILGTMAMLTLMPQEQASRLGGLAQSLDVALKVLHLSAVSPLVLGLLAFALLGQLSAWFGAAARLPFAAGLDKGLPEIFAYRDPKTGAPVTAIGVQVVLVLLILGLSQAGQSLNGIYDFIISMSIISYTLPFLFLFAAFIVAQAKPATGLDWQTPGGPKWARPIGILGLIVALSAIIGSLLPASGAKTDLEAASKLFWATLVMILSGAGLYGLRYLPKRKKP